VEKPLPTYFQSFHHKYGYAKIMETSRLGLNKLEGSGFFKRFSKPTLVFQAKDIICQK
jgi:hypothetical protein